MCGVWCVVDVEGQYVNLYAIWLASLAAVAAAVAAYISSNHTVTQMIPVQNIYIYQ